jgi:membrane associated rhomboid family serine protease
VLGGYILLYPTRRVTVLLFRFLTDVPAYVAIGIWFGFQLISGLGMLGGGAQQGGVAYAAHVGGFIRRIGSHQTLRHRQTTYGKQLTSGREGAERQVL